MILSGNRTMIVGIHGLFRPYPWVESGLVDGSLEIDDFDTVLQRSEALGIGGVGSAARPLMWHHCNAGGDWAHDGVTREVAWMHVDVERHSTRRIPILPAASLLDEVIQRAGSYDFRGLHAVLPLEMMGDHAPAAEPREWLKLADPAASCTFEVRVRTSGQEPLPIEHLMDSAATLATAFGVATFANKPTYEFGATGSGQYKLTGDRDHFVSTAQPTIIFRANGGQWSLDLATWTLEILIDTLRINDVSEPTLISVFRV